MLMALLPLSGWAIDISTVYVPAPYYGTVPTTASIKVYTSAGVLVTDENYEIDGFFKNSACTTAAEAEEIQTANVGETFYVKVTGKNGFTGSPSTSFTIQAMPLTVTVTNASKTYLQDDPASFTISSVYDYNFVDRTDALKSSITVNRKPGNDVLYDTDGNVIGYGFTATISNSNYAIDDDDVAGTFTINPKPFTKTGSTPTVKIEVSGTYTYNGSAQLPTVTVTDLATSAVLTKDVDFTVTDGANTNASTSATVKVTGMGNYAATENAATFTIKKAPLLVTPTATKVYDGYDGLDLDGDADPEVPVSYTYQGWLDAEIPEVTVGATVSEVTDAAAIADEYELNITTNLFTVEGSNYEFKPQPGTFTITPAPVTFTAKDKDITYGEAEEYELTTGWKDDVINADEDDLELAVKITRAETPEASGDHKGKYKLTPSYRTDEEIANYVEAHAADLITGYAGMDADEKAAAKLLKIADIVVARNNYMAAKDGEGTVIGWVDGYATMAKATLMIALKESAYDLTKVYDGENISIDLDKENGLFISPAAAASEIDLSGLTVTPQENEEGAGTANVGTYALKLSGAVAANYEITYIPSQYKITKRPVVLNIYEQTFVKGTVPTVVQNYKVADKTATTGLVDEVSEVFKLELNTTIVTVNEDGEITKAAGSYDAIVPVAASATSKFGNYDFGAVTGKATIINEAIVLDDTKDLTEVIEDAVTGTFSFSARTLNTEQWNVLVLPGKISVKDLAAAFDYAVIDVLDESKSDGNIHFKLKVSGDIEANTPFMIYPSNVKNNLNQVVLTLTGVTKPGATVEVADQGGNKFVGTYKTQGIFGADFRYLSKGTWYNASKYDASNPCNIKPLRGYLDLSGNTNAARAMIFIEELNGETTAIQAVSGETVGKNLKNDGWYNLNGVKLQSAPTQKGVYINNGKKIVVK